MRGLLISLIVVFGLWAEPLFAATAQDSVVDTTTLKYFLQSAQNNDNISETLEEVAEYVVEDESATKYLPSRIRMFEVLFILITVFLLLMLALPIFVGLNNVVRKRINNRRAKIASFYKPKIFEYLSITEENQSVPLLGRRFHPVNKRVLLNILYELSLYVRGEDRRKLERIYKFYRLDKYLTNKIRSPFVWLKSYYLKMLSTLEPSPDSIVLLERLMHHSNSQIRLYAIQAIIRLDPRRIIGIFYTYKYKLSLWEQINYYDFFISKDVAIPDFHPLVLSKNDTIAAFALRMIRIFHQRQGSIKGYEQLLTHPNLMVQVEMFKSLVEFEYENLSEMLSELIPRTSPYIRTHIITYLARQHYATTPLLMQYYRDNDDYNLRLHILYCIYNFVEGGKDDILAFTRQSEDMQLQKLSNHLLNNVL